MLRKLVVLGIVALLPTLAWAQPEQGNWELTLTGNGGSDTDFNSNSIGATGGLGYYLTKNAELGVRQDVTYSQVQDVGHSWTGSTRVFFDWNIDLDQFVPFVGINGGYAYGDQNDSWLAALEGGLKYFVHKDVFVYGQVEYQWLVKHSFGDGRWVYSLGIGLEF